MQFNILDNIFLNIFLKKLLNMSPEKEKLKNTTTFQLKDKLFIILNNLLKNKLDIKEDTLNLELELNKELLLVDIQVDTQQEDILQVNMLLEEILIQQETLEMLILQLLILLINQLGIM